MRPFMTAAHAGTPLPDTPEDYDDNGKRLFLGYVASREVKASIDNLDRPGSWLDTALASGFTAISDVSFKSSREVVQRQEARALAVADALEKATSSRMDSGGRYLQPTIDFTGRVSAVYEISR